MDEQYKRELKQLVREGTIDALESSAGQLAIVKALRTTDAQEIFAEQFAEAFHEVVVPVFEERDEKLGDHETRILDLEQQTRIIS
jgi:hypothetical protein